MKPALAMPFFVVAALLVPPPAAAAASWIQIPEGLPDYDQLPSGAASTVAADGATLYVGTATGIARSVDGGATWKATTLQQGLPSNDVVKAWAGGGVVLAQTRSGLARSTDGGATFQPVSGLPGSVTSLFGDQDVVLVGTDQGLALSKDRGATWKLLFAGRGITNAVRRGSTIYALSWQDLLMTKDEGATSTTKTFELPQRVLLATDVQVLVGGDGLYVTSDDGQTFTKVPELPGSGRDTYVQRGATDGHDVTLIVGEGFSIASRDGGVTWSLDWDTAAVTDLARSGDHVYGSIGSGGVGVFDASLAKQTMISSPLHVSSLLRVLDGKLFYGESVSTDAGHTFAPLDPGFPFDLVAASGDLLALASSSDRSKLSVSVDGGRTWTPSPLTTSLDLDVTALAAREGELDVATNVGLVFSLDKGLQYHLAHLSPPPAKIADMAWAGKHLFAVGDGVKVGVAELSANYGFQVKDLTPASAHGYCPDAKVTPLGSRVYVTSYCGVAVSTDDGATWTPVFTGLPAGTQVTGIGSFGDRLYLGTDKGLYLSTDGGTTSQKDEFLGDQGISAVTSDDHDVYVATPVGMFRFGAAVSS